MALGIFKRKKEKAEKEEKKEEEVLSVKAKEKIEAKKEVEKKKVEKKKAEEKPLKDLKKEPPTGSKKSAEKKERLAWRVIKEPHITEKATLLAERNEYVFKVFPKANKPEIKKAIEEIYGVDVEKVRIINVPRKKRRRGRVEGWRKGYKKAIVKIKEGQVIEILPR